MQEAVLAAKAVGPLGSSSGQGLPQVERIRLNVHANQVRLRDAHASGGCNGCCCLHMCRHTCHCMQASLRASAYIWQGAAVVTAAAYVRIRA